MGAVLLAFDMTEQEYAERNRREFTANVSHELKTPLQGILGSAELIEKGMVQPEDVPRFIGQIRTEATRMVTLIGDIIRLSQLDEGDEMPREKVELFALAEEVTDSLKDEAAKKKVTLVVEGQAASIEGVRRLLYEIFYNLCDNAIKYNVPGGSVHFFVDSNEKSRSRKGGGHWRRHSGGRSVPGVRTLLPGGQEPLQGLRRYGTGPVHRQARRAVSSRLYRTEKRTGQGHGDHVHFPEMTKTAPGEMILRELLFFIPVFPPTKGTHDRPPGLWLHS